MLDSEKWCTFLICSIISLQVVLQVLHLYFIKKEKVRIMIRFLWFFLNHLSSLSSLSPLSSFFVNHFLIALQIPHSIKKRKVRKYKNQLVPEHRSLRLVYPWVSTIFKINLTYCKILFEGMGQLINCKICGREFESEEVLKKHQSFCTFSRRKYYIERRRWNGLLS